MRSWFFGRRLALGGVVVATLMVLTAGAVDAKPGIETVYANGQSFAMLTPHAIDNPNPNLLATAPPFYVLAYPMTPAGPILPAGYSPQCDPCLGVPVPPYHDHLLTSAPGFGVDGTAGDYMGPWRVVVMMYSPAYVQSSDFVPVTSDEQLAGAEADGAFLPIAPPGAPNPFELYIPTILICPVTAPQA